MADQQHKAFRLVGLEMEIYFYFLLFGDAVCENDKMSLF